MSQPRTRSQGPPDAEISEGTEESVVSSQSLAEGRMSQELQVKLEVMKLYPAQNDKEEETLQMQLRLMRPASAMVRPTSTILPALRSNSALGNLVPKEVSTKSNQYHVVPIHNSNIEDGRQNHITGLTLPRNQDNNENDLEVAEIVLGTASMSSTSGPEEEAVSPDNFFDASDKPIETENYGKNEITVPAANTFTAIRGDDEWLKRYLPDSHNSQIGNVPNRVEITTEDGEEWYRIRIPYLDQFYNTEVYLVGAQSQFP